MHIPRIAPILALASTTIVTALPAGDKNPGKHAPIDADNFITVDGLRLRDGAGSLHYVTGINYWACMNLAADASVGGDYARFITELDQMVAKGINHLRVMAASEGAPGDKPQPFRMNPPLLKAPGEYNEEIFVGLDICLAEMQKRGMRATMTLNNEWQWTGGFGQYVSWTDNDSKIPYPPSWNLTAPPQRTVPNSGWGNYTEPGVDASSWGNYTLYANTFYENADAQGLWRDHIKTVLNRVNTMNGRKYSEDSTIMAWQLANEPQPEIVFEEGVGPYKIENPPGPGDPIIAWVKDSSEYIKSLAPKHLVSVGFEGKQGKWYWQAVHNFSTIDYGTAHCWSQNWGIYNMTNSSLANLDRAKHFAQEFISNTSEWAAELNKPIILEEFGLARNNWENIDEEYLYLSSAGTSNKDSYFETIISAVLEEFKNPEGAYIGTAPWSYGGLYRPETQHVNEFGMVWAGDPPHESPGWYDLYDTDEAMNIIHRQQQDAMAFMEAAEKL